jgi:cell division protein FtsB
MQETKSIRNKIRKYIVLFILLLGTIISLRLMFSIIDTWNKYTIVSRQTDTYVSLTEEQKTLQDKLKYVLSPAFIEKTARESLGLSKPGEIIVQIDSSKTENNHFANNQEQSNETTPSATNKNIESTMWKKWLDIFN